MAELIYSDDAENVLCRFYGVKTIVYVEGKDDIPFWEHIFETFAKYSVQVHDAGGVSEIQKYIDRIESGKINAVIACDADFSYADKFPDHKNILRSYGYSIENSMICISSLKKIIRSVGRVPLKNIDENEISIWFKQFGDATNTLVVHDIANHILQEGKVVTGDNCTRFMKSAKSSEVCPKKVQEYLDGIDLKISNKLRKSIATSLENSNRNEFDLLRGHFLFSASLKFVVSKIKQLGKNVSISNDSFFGSLFIAFESVFNNNHEHYNYYRDIVRNTDIST